MREKILELLKRKGEKGVLQSEIPQTVNLSKSTVSEQLSELERNKLVFREKVAGKSNRVWLTEEVPHPIEGTIRIGVLRAAEYPHVMIASENLGEETLVSVFDSAKKITAALAKGKLDIAFSPLITQILYSLTSENLKVCAGCALGGYGIVSEEPPSETTSFGSSQLSTMEMSLRTFLEDQELDPYTADIQYFESPEEIFNSCLNGKTKTVAIWEPYFSLLENALENPETYTPFQKTRGFPCCTMGVNNRFLKRSEAPFLKFAKHYIEATKAVTKGKKLKKSADLLSDKTGLDKNLLRVSFKSYKFDWRLSEEKIMNYIKKFNLKVSPRDFSQTFKTEYMTEAL